MAGLFDYQDPESVGRMMFAAGLLNAAGPSKMPVSTGQALAQGLMGRQQGASEAAQNARRNLLMEAQARNLDARSMAEMMDRQQGQKKPAALQIAEAYMQMSPEQRAIFDHTNKAQIVDVGGVKYLRTPEGSVPLVSQEIAAGNAAAIAGARQNAIEGTKAGYDVMPTFDPATKQDVFTTRARVLGIPNAPMQRPPLSAFGQPMPQQAPMQNPNPSAAGMNPSGYRSVEELRAAMANEVATMPPIGVQPPAAGDAVRAQAKEAVVKDEQYKAKLREAYPKAKSSFAELNQNVDRGLRLIDDLEKSKGAWLNTGLISNVPVRFVKGTSAFDDESKMQTLRDQVVIKTVMNMKALSETGATGFGQLSEKEGARLENNMATLVTGQTKEARQNALNEIKAAFTNIKNNSKDSFNTEFGQYEAEALRKKYGLQ